MECPICGSKEFNDFRGRSMARCRGCGSFERSRLLWMVLRDLPFGERPVMHFAPEIGIAKKLRQRLGSHYRAYDFQPELYRKAGVEAQPFDLCVDTQKVPRASVGVICHVHVLEHVRCNAAFVLRDLNALLAEGGYHVFGIPFTSDYFREDLSPELTEADHLERFGHEDHVRSFGARDFEVMFGPAFEGMERVDVGKQVGAAALAEANVPPRALTGLSAHSILVYRKLVSN